jgi:site-specific DNA-methyltransferase (adenine-specific)/adenine-specific DNA-methyltransferase
MPTLHWIGKEAVVKHHKDVPYRLLERVPELDCGVSDSGNLIVQGDNLHALKALLPRFAGQVKCIYIDPPYNTGNEGWVYNDNVNSPEIRKWLGSVVGKEDETLDRHDRWLCMMYPRLLLLKQFLRDDGVIFVSIDDNEHASLKLLMDEIFGGRNFLTSFIWKKRSGSNDSKNFLSVDHEYIVAYQKTDAAVMTGVIKDLKKYKNPDNDERGAWAFDNLTCNKTKEERPNLFYDITNPETGAIYSANPHRVWVYERERMQRMIEQGKVIFPKNGTGTPQYKRHLSELRNLSKPVSSWIYPSNTKDSFVGISTSINSIATKELRNIFDKQLFDYPKPVDLLEGIINQATDENSIILDSFAGSGTTAHAVLNLNKQDGGNRQFILVEIDKTIAETVTVERNKRVIEGYNNAKGEPVEGLGGGFQFYRLSKEPLFTADGQVRPDVTFAQLAEFVWFKETGTGFTGNADSPLLGVFNNNAVYLLYNGILGDCDPEKGNVLTPSIYKTLPPFQGRKIIYATACRGGDSWLNREQIVFKQTPYELNV